MCKIPCPATISVLALPTSPHTDNNRRLAIKILRLPCQNDIKALMIGGHYDESYVYSMDGMISPEQYYPHELSRPDGTTVTTARSVPVVPLMEQDRQLLDFRVPFLHRDL